MIDVSINKLKIDPAIFEFRFGCECKGECCHYGVYADLREYELITSIKDEIIPFLDNTQTRDASKWFEAPEKDDDFESGFAVGTELHNNKCVFLDCNGLCTLQKLAISKNEYSWKYKPLYCILFPLTIYQNSLTIDYEHIERLKTCNLASMQQKSIYEFCRAELLHLFGEEGVATLDKANEEYNKRKALSE